jgi:hypothetical protein
MKYFSVILCQNLDRFLRLCVVSSAKCKGILNCMVDIRSIPHKVLTHPLRQSFFVCNFVHVSANLKFLWLL